MLEGLLTLAACYVGLGLTFALIFVIAGVQRVDPAARGASVGFRLLILPGAAAFWPLLLWRWWRGVVMPPTERNAHRERAQEARK